MAGIEIEVCPGRADDAAPCASAGEADARERALGFMRCAYDLTQRGGIGYRAAMSALSSAMVDLAEATTLSTSS